MAEWTANVIERISALGASKDDLLRLYVSATGDPILDYNLFMHNHFGLSNAYTPHALGTSFPIGSSYADKINLAALDQVYQLSLDLIDQLNASSVRGAIVEFGVAAGNWLARVLDHMDQSHVTRETFGFDSFEGLPDPDPQNDGDAWAKGQFANSVADVSKRLKQSQRPHLNLLPGWFSGVFETETAQCISEISFAKVDCDLYGPTVECLDYLDGRLSHGSVLMFDDWTHLATLGETKAFMEWVPRVPQYRFEFVGFINWRIFFRVWHR